MKHTVFVDGQEGTTGLRIHEVLAQRRDIELLRIAADKRKDSAERARLLNAADVAFLCLPDAAAKEAAALVTNPKTCLIDASTAHRTAAGWVFGLPELAPGQRDAIRKSKRIANPGCHASAFILLLRPLVDAGIVPASLAVSATSITGYSGGGKKMIEQYEQSGDARLTSPRPYGLAIAHKHIPEMMAHTGLATKPLFMPVVGNFYKGLAVSVPLHLSQLGKAATAQGIQRCFEQRYAGEPFVRVMPLSDPATLEEGFFDVQACNDSNRADLFVFANDTQVLLFARLDNLGKGASGAAVQAMNVHLGVDEGLGLSAKPVRPLTGKVKLSLESTKGRSRVDSTPSGGGGGPLPPPGGALVPATRTPARSVAIRPKAQALRLTPSTPRSPAMPGKFELKKSSNGKYFFNLLASNGQIVLTSEMYESKSAATNGIDSVKKNAADAARYEKLDGKDGKTYFTLKAANHQVIGKSQMYASTDSRDGGIESVKNHAGGAEVDDQT